MLSLFDPDSSGASSSAAPVDGAVDLREEEMEQSVFGLSFALDPSAVPQSLHLSNSSLSVTYRGESPPGPPPDNKVRGSMTSDPGGPLALPQVCADVVITRGQYYWEVDVCNSSVYRIGVSSLNGPGGWWLERRGLSFCAVYDGSREPLCTVPPQIKTLGVFLNMGGCTLSFHNPLTQEHLATLPTRFDPAGVVPALALGQGRLRLRCGLPPPAHVFLSKDSAYRGPCGAGGGRWRREIPFHSVRIVIQKFEELAVSDSDSGLVSSFGSSCSTLASLPDLGMCPSGQAGQETGAE
ncbi:probable E3 ubiquitin-protein ligase MID2 [Centropristis striata]|uniref:probable E3 ubiquitin-protein ligase MID2 n=1 Tax=Centropristis striata TaxID=184440 RepID=UPI0027E1BEFA|nr:probable E3 ubiquitin-protein ligase MID2 [Centropristis striata]